MVLTEVGRCAHCGWHRTLAGILDCMKERDGAEPQCAPITLCLSTVAKCPKSLPLGFSCTDGGSSQIIS